MDLFDQTEEEKRDREDITKLYRDVLDYRNGVKFKKMLDFCVRFRKLSVFNCALLQTQRPGCQFALTATQWRRRYRRVVKTDACPLVVIRPFGPVGFVFDVGDTVPLNGEPDVVPKDITRDFDIEASKTVPARLFSRVKANLPFWGVKYGEMSTGRSYYGKIEVAHECDGFITLDCGKNRSLECRPAYTLKVAAGTCDTNAFGTILHEMGHLACRHIHCAYEKGWSDMSGRTKLGHDQEEFEAQTISWLVGHRCGVDIPSTYGYLAEYLGKDREIPPVDFAVMFQAANEVEKTLRANTIKDGWLWKYTPSLQERYKRLG